MSWVFLFLKMTGSDHDEGRRRAMIKSRPCTAGLPTFKVYVTRQYKEEGSQEERRPEVSMADQYGFLILAWEVHKLEPIYLLSCSFEV